MPLSQRRSLESGRLFVEPPGTGGESLSAPGRGELPGESINQHYETALQ